MQFLAPPLALASHALCCFSEHCLDLGKRTWRDEYKDVTSQAVKKLNKPLLLAVIPFSTYQSELMRRSK
jgi:hypothetical protein